MICKEDDAQIRRAATRPGVLYVKPPRTRLFTAPEWLWPVVKIGLTVLVAAVAGLFFLLRRTRGIWVDMLSREKTRHGTR